MELLCQAVRSELTKAYETEAATNWDITSNTPESCTVRSVKFELKFMLDPRNKLVSSSITFLEADDIHQEELYSHIISKMFPRSPWDQARDMGTIENSVSVEVANVLFILKSVESGALLPRDLFYFHSGYSCAYTDCLSVNE